MIDFQSNCTLFGSTDLMRLKRPGALNFKLAARNITPLLCQTVNKLKRPTKDWHNLHFQPCFRKLRIYDNDTFPVNELPQWQSQRCFSLQIMPLSLYSCIDFWNGSQTQCISQSIPFHQLDALFPIMTAALTVICGLVCTIGTTPLSLFSDISDASLNILNTLML